MRFKVGSACSLVALSGTLAWFFSLPSISDLEP